MNKFFAVLLCLFAYLFSPAQYNLQYESLKKLSFPSKIDSMVSKGVTMFYGGSPEFVFECLASHNSHDTLSQKESYHSLQLFVEGFFSSESLKNYQREQVDTTLSGIEGIIVHAYQSSTPTVVKEWFVFFTIVGRTNFVIAAGVMKGLQSDLRKKFDNFLTSAMFEGKNYLPVTSQ